MKALSRKLDRFCIKHPNFGIRNLMLFIIIGNAIVYLFTMMDTTGSFAYYLYFNPQLILQGEIWRLITFVFVPGYAKLWQIVLSLYFSYFIGSTLERYWGTAKFTLYYLSGVVFTMIYGLIAGLLTDSGYMLLDASYINLSMFFTFALFFPDTQLLLFFIIPIKIKWLAIVDAAFFVVSILLGTFPTNLLPLIAVLNFFIFCGDRFFGLFKQGRARNYKTSVNFRNKVASAKMENEHKDYRHKCSVCGKTDTQYPDLQFRYCSRCQGYHCFCEEHINNHIHFTE